MPKPKEQNQNVLKQFVAKIDVDEDERAVTATISTSGIDRDGEIVMAKGGQLENFLKNPVVLWAHNHSSTPIARALWVKQSRGKLIAKAKFAEHEFAQEVFDLYKGGFLQAFSIGFIPTKTHKPTPNEIKKNPEWAEVWRVIDEWEMLEFSAVPVPANPEALATAVKTKNITLSPNLAKDFEVESPTPDDDVVHYAANNIKEPTGDNSEQKNDESNKNKADIIEVALDVETINTIKVEIEKEAVEVEPFIDIKAEVEVEILRKKGVMFA